MHCNIDARGRLARLITGLMTLVAGLALLLLAVNGALTGWWPWLLAAAALGTGAFQVYEGWAGWCVMRAMGFRTPM